MSPAPLYPLATDSWDEREYEAIQRVLRSRQFTMSSEVRAFEEDFAEFFGVRHAVMVNSGSSANLLAVGSLLYHPRQYLKPGDEVIVPTVSWGTTYFPLQHYGLRLRFVDIDRDTLNLDLPAVSAAVTPATRAVLAVNLLGNPNDFASLEAICRDNHLLLIEDNCESMGAVYAGRYTGTFGICGTFSSFFSHHISTMEGGVVVTDDEELYHTLLALRSHGWTRDQPAHSHLAYDDDPFRSSYRFVLPGYNLRPLELSGAIGREQLKKLPGIVSARRDNAACFQELFGDLAGIRTQQETGRSSWFGLSMLLEEPLAGKRRDLAGRLTAAGIQPRPIVAGNFLCNPVLKYLDHVVTGGTAVADAVEANGLFIGNHHYDVRAALRKVREIVAGFVQETVG